MRLLVVGDPHLKISNLGTAKKFLDQLLAAEHEGINGQRPSLVAITGDLFDTHAVMRVEVLNLWVDYIDRTDPKIPHVLQVGNHDKAGPNADQHALVALERFHNIVVADGPTTTEDGIGFMPYYHLVEQFEEAIKAIPKDVETLFVHNTFQGAQYENGFYDPDAFPLELVARFKRVIGGHVHRAQTVGNVRYVGSPFAQSFQDAGEVKGISLLEPGKVDSWIRRDLRLPAYHALRFGSVESFLDSFEDLEPKEQDHFRVTISTDKAGASLMATDPKFLALKRRYKLTVSTEISSVTRQPSLLQRAIGLEAMADAYVGDVMQTSLDRDRLLKTVHDVLGGTRV